MVLPVVAYGDPVLRKVSQDIDKDYKNLSELIENMFETMYDSNGVGIAAPQIGRDIRLFVVDCSPFAEDEDYEDVQEELQNFKKIFINPKKISESEGDEWKFAEGCLSIPHVHEDVARPESITLEYYDENWVKHTETFSDIRARVIQHEYDHLEGILFIDYISSFKKKLISNKLKNITKGNVNTSYKMKFPV